ncbi:MAG: T9SS type A sorting domain-containing protein [Bacteroidales bacterium]|jgi:hypothetical protein|nr:T9SS type A sorting domain-containing protein [Bacteroidales bacterium]
MRKIFTLLVVCSTIGLYAQRKAGEPIVARQLNAFEALKNNLDGDNWRFKTIEDLMARDKSPYIRLYDGVLNYNGTGHKRIDILDLSNNNMSGIIPEAFNYVSDDIGNWKHTMTNYGVAKFSHNNITDASKYIGFAHRTGYYKGLWLDHNKLEKFDMVDPYKPPISSSGFYGHSSGEEFVINNNEIKDLDVKKLGQPAMDGSSCIIGWSTKLIRIDNNRLPFADIIALKNFMIGNKSYIPTGGTSPGCAYEFVYAPQKAIGGDNTEVVKNEGETIPLTFALEHAKNQYTWLLNGKPVNVSGKNLTVTNFDASQAGVYTCKVTNPDAPELTLYSYDMAVWYNKEGNNAPTDISLNNTNANNKMPLYTNVAEITGTDADEDELYFRLDDKVADNASFRIVNGKTLITAEDLFSRHYIESYTIVVEAYDCFGGKFTKEFTINKGEVTSTIPYPTKITMSANSIDENVVKPIGTIDLEGVNDGNYTLSLPEALDNAKFELSGNSLSPKSAFDFEQRTNYTVRVKLTSSDSQITIEKDFDIKVQNVNDAPHGIILTDDQMKVDEPLNSIIAVIIAEDQDVADEDFTFELSAGGEHNKFFKIYKNRLISSKNFNDSDIGNKNIKIKVTDPAGATFEKNFVISVKATVTENKSPRGMGITNMVITSAMNAEDVLAYIYMSDPEGEAGTFTCDNQYIKIEDNQLIIKEKPAEGTSFTIKISGSDGENTIEQSFTVYATKVSGETDVIQTETEQYFVYPNPAQNSIAVKGIDNGPYTIFNINGNEIMRTGSAPINVSGLKPGTYIIKCNANGIQFSKTFIKR